MLKPCSDRTQTPLPGIGAADLALSCQCILNDAGSKIPTIGSGGGSSVPKANSVACSATLKKEVADHFVYAPAFCRFFATLFVVPYMDLSLASLTIR